MEPKATVGRHKPRAVALSSASPATLSAPPVTANAKPEDLILYGSNNRLPNELLGLALTSSTAKRCFDKRSNFIEADGFQDAELSKLPVAPGKTADSLLHETVNRVADMGGIAWAVRYDMAGTRLSVKVLPFTCVRKRVDGNFILNHDFADATKKSRDEKKDLFFYKWEPNLSPQKLAAQFEALKKAGQDYNGHLYYDFDADIDLYTHYPLPDWYSAGAVADIEADAQASLLDRKNISQGFMAGVHVKATGEQYKDLEERDSEGNITYTDSPAMEGLTDSIKDLKGSSTDATALITYAPVAEEGVEINILDTGKAYNGMTDITDRIAFKVCKALGVNPILVGLTVSGRLGTSQEMNESAVHLAKEMLPKQNIITRAFTRIFPVAEGKNWNITSLAPTPNLLVEALTSLPALVTNQLIPFLTETEIRSVMGLVGTREEALKKEAENANNQG